MPQNKVLKLNLKETCPDIDCISYSTLTVCAGAILTFRFVHTADLHLDAPLKAIALRDPDLAREVGVASRTAFSRTVNLCILEEVVFLLIAGDLWDGAYSSTKTPRFLKQELLRLKAAGIRCFIIRGNHDAMARQTGELELPDNTVLFGGRAGTVEFEVDGQRVAIHGLSFRDVHAAESLLPRYPAAQAGAFNIGMMHTSLNGSPGHDNYAPCSVSDLDAHGYAYWALGHIHRRSTHIGRASIVMPGIPQGRDIGEDGPASVTLVTVGDDEAVTLEQRSVASLRFDRLELDYGGIEDWPQLLSILEQGVRQAGQTPRSEDHLVIRPILHGITPLAWRIVRDVDRLTEEARAFAAAAGIWIDRLELRVSAPDDMSALAGANLPDDLVRVVLNDLPQDPGLNAALKVAAQDLVRDLPAELRDILGQDQAELERHCAEFLMSGTPFILSRLTSDEAV